MGFKRVEGKAFVAYPWAPGKLADCDPNFPSELYCWDGNELTVAGDATYFGYVFEGVATIDTPHGDFNLKTGMYFSVPGSVTVRGGKGILIARLGEHSFLNIGGPVEDAGRLKYIDGCTDSLLIPPVKMGDACLNLLCFPENIDQTAHTHPSDRIGVVASGRGECVTPEGIINLEPGMIFRIVAEGNHKFRTLLGEPMRVIAFHPDSDFGPTDEVHPMINRTIVNGVSASALKKIHTKVA